jgi:archaemetzincin
MQNRHWIGVVVAAGLLVGIAAVGNPGDQLATIRAAGERIKPLHAAKGKPQPGDWLESHPEPGQTFDEYLTSRPNRPTATRTTIYIQPLGQFDEKQSPLIDDTAEMMHVFFGVPVKRLEPIGLDTIPAKARRTHPTWGVKQILSTYVLDLLEERRPRDAVAVIALTTSDLWPGEGWNFVFGQASLTNRVGVWSLARNGDTSEDYTLVLRRTLKTAVHETGHMLGILHCVAYECGMNGSNNLEESDRTPLWFCPECEQKIWWACPVQPAARYEQLEEFARKRQLIKTAEFWAKSRSALDAPR